MQSPDTEMETLSQQPTASVKAEIVDLIEQRLEQSRLSFQDGVASVMELSYLEKTLFNLYMVFSSVSTGCICVQTR